MAAAQDSDVDQETQDQGAEEQASSQFQPAGNSIIHWQDTAPADDSEQAAQPEQPEEPEQPEQPKQFQPAGKSVIRWHQPPQQPQQPADQAEAQPPSQLAQMFPSIYGEQRAPEAQPVPGGPAPKAQPVPGGPVPRAQPTDQLIDIQGRDPAPVRYNNPSGMWNGPSASRYGSTAYGIIGGGNHIAAFDTPEQGAAAQFDLLASRSYVGMPIVDAVRKWTGDTGGEDQVQSYAAQIAKAAGVDVNSPITPDLLQSPAGIALAKAQAKMETGYDYPMSHGQWQNAQQMAYGGVPTAAQPARRGGGGRGAPAPTTVPWTVNWITDEEVAEARRQTQQDKLQALPDEMVALNNLQQQNQNPAAMMKALDQPIKGVSDDTRQDYAANYKQQVTKEAQQFYNEPDPDKALAKATSSAGPVEFAEQVGRQFFAKAGNLDVGLNKFFANTDDAQVNNFVSQLQPDAMPEGKAAFMKHLASLDPTTRAQTIGTLFAGLPPAVQASMSSVGIADAADRLASPQYQAAQTEAIQKKQDWLDKTAKTDPNFKGTPAEYWTDQLASLGVNALTAFIPAPIRNTLWFSQFYSDGKDKLKDEHPDWSEGDLNSHASASAVVQLASQEALAGIIAGKLGPLTEAITNPFARAGARALTETAINVGSAGVAQTGANIAEQRPLLENVPQALAAGAVQGGVPGLVHGAGELRRPAETRAEVTPPTEAQPTEPQPPLPARGEVAPVEAQPPREQPAPITVRGEPAPETATPRPVTQEDVARRAYEMYDERTKNGQPGTALDDWHQAQAELNRTSEPILPGTMSEAEPITSAIANRYVQERMAIGELGQIDPSQGQSTEDMIAQGLQMSRTQRDGLIDNFLKAKGGDLDQQGAAIRSKEALLSEQARAASRTANADPTNPQLQAQAKAAADAVTAFHNGPIKKFKQVWSDSGRVLQREIPLDYTTFNGMKEAYLKGKNKEAPAEFEPKLKQMAEAVSKITDAERVAINNWGKEIENQTRGKTLPADDQIRTRLMEIMKDLPCPT
jgi:hypothetical protein